MKAIFAVNALNGFGDGQDMPWPRNPQDLSRFREITSGKTVVMGAGTWNSNMPKPLPNRRNIVLSRTLADERCEVYANITDLLMNVTQNEDVYVIGGAQTLWMLKQYVQEVYLTRFHALTPATITLDTEKYLEGFTRESSQDFGDHTFEIYRRT
jgi:dihydrofolate reductase